MMLRVAVFRRLSLFVLAWCVGPVSAWAASPGKVPLLMPSGAMAVVSVEPRAAYVFFADFSAAMRETIGKDFADPLPGPLVAAMNLDERQLEMLKTFSDKCKSIRLYLVPGPQPGMTLPMLVLQGSMTPDEILAPIRVKMDPRQQQMFTPQPTENGRYDLPMGVIVYGKEAGDLDDGVVVFLPKPLLQNLQELLASLGSEPGQDLAGLMKKVDTSMPVWGCGISPSRDPSALSAVWGQADFAGPGRMEIHMQVRTPDDAAESSQGISKTLGTYKADSLLAVSNAGPVVTIALKPGKIPLARRLPGPLVRSLNRARKLAQRAMSGANLNGIGRGVALYRATHEDQSPPDLAALVAEGLVSHKMLLSPLSGRAIPPSGPGENFKPDYVYIPLPGVAPGDLILAYEPPALSDYEIAQALHNALHVTVMTPTELIEQLQATRRWCKEQGLDIEVPIPPAPTPEQKRRAEEQKRRAEEVKKRYERAPRRGRATTRPARP